MKPKTDWWSCDGGGNRSEPAAPVRAAGVMSRRNLLAAVGLGTISWLGKESALAQIALKPGRQSDEVLVVVFLRGGADGLNVVVPYGEDAYYKLRPSLHIPSPKDGSSPQSERAIDLNGFFGLHPAMAAIRDLYAAGQLSFVHACGSFDETRSHFDAMSAMERGLPEAAGSVSSGWLARHLDTTPADRNSPLRAVAFGDVLPDSLRGAPGAVALNSLADFKLDVPETSRPTLERELTRLYAAEKDAVSAAGVETLAAMRTLNALDLAAYQKNSRVQYPKSDLGNGLSQVALLVKSGVGLEVACLDKGGWDTHVAQGSTTGWQAGLMNDLSQSLSAFAQDLGPRIGHVTTLVMTEFGRRAYENSGLGTDHGRASFMMLMGGGTKGGQVFANWPGLEEGQLEGPGDLRVTTDYRNVLAEVLQEKLGNRHTDEVFPGLTFRPPGFTA